MGLSHIICDMNEILVSKLDAEPIAPPLEELQPVFFDCRGRLCPVFPSAEFADAYLDYLEHKIQREPNDLTAHVRRIMIARAYARREILAAALQNLFRILGSRGKGLRSQLLKLCVPLLDSTLLLDIERFSVVSRQSAEVPFIKRLEQGESRAAKEKETDPLAEALACLETGQVEEARTLLERFLSAQSDHVEATKVLLDIYLRSRNGDAFAAMRQQIEPIPASVRSLWQKAADSFAALS